MSTIPSIRYFIPVRTGVEVPDDQAAGLSHQHREFLAGCEFIQGSNGELSISTVQPGCAENVLSLNF